MRLTDIEGDFLKRLSLEPWTSPPIFDHGLLERMVRENYVTTQATVTASTTKSRIWVAQKSYRQAGAWPGLPCRLFYWAWS